MATLKRSPRGKLRSQQASAYSLDDVVQETLPLAQASSRLRSDQIRCGAGPSLSPVVPYGVALWRQLTRFNAMILCATCAGMEI